MYMMGEGIVSRGNALYKGVVTREYLTVLYSFLHFEFSNSIFKKFESSEYPEKEKYCAQISLNMLTY